MSIHLSVFALPARFSSSALPFLESIQTQNECVVFLSERQRVNKADTHPHQRLGMDGTQIRGACPVPFTLHPHSHCSSSLPLLSKSLQGRRSAASLWLLWLCRSQQGGHIRSTGSTTCSRTDYNLCHTYAADTLAYAVSKMYEAYSWWPRNKTNHSLFERMSS